MMDIITFPQVRYLVDGRMLTKGEIQLYQDLGSQEAVQPVVYSGRLAWLYSTMLVARFSIVELALLFSILYY